MSSNNSTALLPMLIPAITALTGVMLGSIGSWLAGHFQYKRELKKATTLRLLEKAEELQYRIAALTSVMNEFIHKIGNAELSKQMRQEYSIKIINAYHQIHAIADLHFPHIVFDPSVKFGTDTTYVEEYIRELFINENSGSWVEGADKKETAKIADSLSSKGIQVSKKLDAYMTNVITYVQQRVGLYDLKKRIPKKST